MDVPGGMIEVTKSVFFASLGDVGPSSEREYTVWRHTKTMELVGFSSHGYTTWCVSNEPAKYYMFPKFVIEVKNG